MCRVWILQEMLIGMRESKAIIRAGQDSMDCAYLVAAVCDLFTNTETTMSKLRVTAGREIVASCFAILAIISDPQLNVTSHRFLIYNSSLRTSDERDRIYGLLGLIQELQIQANYNDPTERVFQNATFAFLQHEKSLDLLLFSRHYRECDLDLPTWVVDWRPSLRKPPTNWDFGFYNALSGRVSDVAVRDDMLKVVGQREFFD